MIALGLIVVNIPDFFGFVDGFPRKLEAAWFIRIITDSSRSFHVVNH
jgi:hypothetical protein